jgi:hypothetical protein
VTKNYTRIREEQHVFTTEGNRRDQSANREAESQGGEIFQNSVKI